MYSSKSCDLQLTQHNSVFMCSSLVRGGFADEYRPMLQSSLRQLVTHCASLLHLLLPKEDGGSLPRYVALCKKLKLTEKVSWQDSPLLWAAHRLLDQIVMLVVVCVSKSKYLPSTR